MGLNLTDDMMPNTYADADRMIEEWKQRKNAITSIHLKNLRDKGYTGTPPHTVSEYNALMSSLASKARPQRAHTRPFPPYRRAGGKPSRQPHHALCLPLTRQCPGVPRPFHARALPSASAPNANTCTPAFNAAAHTCSGAPPLCQPATTSCALRTFCLPTARRRAHRRPCHRHPPRACAAAEGV